MAACGRCQHDAESMAESERFDAAYGPRVELLCPQSAWPVEVGSDVVPQVAMRNETGVEQQYIRRTNASTHTRFIRITVVRHDIQVGELVSLKLPQETP